MLPEILVNDAKCPDPLSCRKCLAICPTEVLGLGTNVGPQKFREIPVGNYVVRGVRFISCTACGECVRVCPNGAIQVKFNGRQ